MSLYLRTDVRHECEEETAPKLSNGTISNDLERPLTKISRSRYYSTSNNSKTVQDRARSGRSLMLNICEMAKDAAVVTMEGE